MKPAVFVDAGVLIHSIDDRDPARRDRARQWLAACWTRRCGRLSTQVLGEFYVAVCRRFPGAVAAGDARAEIRRYQHWKPWAVDQPTIESAWAVEARYGLDHWDALLVASAQQQGCAYLLSDALKRDQPIDGVRIIDPFVIGPDILDASPAP